MCFPSRNTLAATCEATKRKEVRVITHTTRSFLLDATLPRWAAARQLFGQTTGQQSRICAKSIRQPALKAIACMPQHLEPDFFVLALLLNACSIRMRCWLSCVSVLSISVRLKLALQNASELRVAPCSPSMLQARPVARWPSMLSFAAMHLRKMCMPVPVVWYSPRSSMATTAAYSLTAKRGAAKLIRCRAPPTRLASSLGCVMSSLRALAALPK